MKSVCLAAALLIALASAPSFAQTSLGESTTVIFATIDQGQAILVEPDDFVGRMSPFDRAARLQTDKSVSQEQYLGYVGKNVLEWTFPEQAKLDSVIKGVQAELSALSLPLPRQILLIKTTGNEEGNAAYTRANAIVLPAHELGSPDKDLQKLFCHELFHVLSRANPVLREELYNAIGFAKCDELAFPAELLTRKLTNPDAPINDHCIRLQVEGKEQWTIPILYSSRETYDVEHGGEFFEYLQFQFLLIERTDSSTVVRPLYDGPKARLVGFEQVSGFLEQVGKNTEYIIHPEEILADNFALLILKADGLPSPDIIEKMKKILKE